MSRHVDLGDKSITTVLTAIGLASPFGTHLQKQKQSAGPRCYRGVRECMQRTHCSADYYARVSPVLALEFHSQIRRQLNLAGARVVFAGRGRRRTPFEAKRVS